MSSDTSIILPSPEQLRSQISQMLLKDRWPLRNRLKRVMKRKSSKPAWEQEYQKLVEQCKASTAWAGARWEQLPTISYPEALPITGHRDAIIQAIQQNQVLIIAGETGSGKTTQLPKLCLEAGQGRFAKIGCTQPRRIAATSMATRISKELDCDVGTAVGYKIRFAEKMSDATFIQMMTDGILLTEMQYDRYLNQYDTIIIDEAHERTLNIDFLLGYLKQLLPKRPDLKLIIASANLDIPRFEQAFDNAPTIEVSGRMYPVTEVYQPLDEDLEEQGEKTITDAMVETIRELLDTTWEGNILAFLPGEVEIREVLERLASHKQVVDVLPLFARLTNKEQNQIFQNISRRKVIVATNIAETSLTIPGVRYVVDSGLARISRFSNRSHTQRLPVEAISQSSANQRKGRAGRVEAGICIRLYSEDSFKMRREFTEPEILRSSLAGVILQMHSLKLGDIESFPFIDRPTSSAIRAGQKLLKELGALNDAGELTSLGKEMARLPIEPRTARMLIAAKEEDAIHEVLVIAAGISIQDPREYPLEKAEHAKQMHSKFIDRASDFTTLINIWNQYHDEWESLKSENKMRKFCKKHFLSFVRLREWRDIHKQLSGILKDSKGFVENEFPADYQAIHASILAGHLNQVGFKKQKNLYQTSGNREMMIFPGSGVFNKGKAWIVSTELIETTRLFARRVANIEVEWLEVIGKGVCRKSYFDAHFDPKSGSVIAYEKVTLHGMVIVPQRRVFYGKVNPAEATAIFIREALVDGNLRSNQDFYRHNQELKEQFISHGAKLRKSYDHEIEACMQDFYTTRLYNIASVHDLNGLLKKKRKQHDFDFLKMAESDFELDSFNMPKEGDFPDQWTLGDQELEIQYQFLPEQEKDGATLQIHENLLPFVEADTIDWLVPGHWEEKIFFLLKALPKHLRKQLVPVSQTAKDIAETLKPTETPFLQVLSQTIFDKYGIRIPSNEWNDDKVPDYLKVRVSLVDQNKKVLAEGRNLPQIINHGKENLLKQNEAKAAATFLPLWQKTQESWELRNLETWSFDSLPKRIEIGSSPGIPLYAYPGLFIDQEGIHRHLFKNEKDAEKATQQARIQLLARNMDSEIAWLERDFRELKEFQEAYRPFGNLTQLKAHCRENVFHYLFQSPWIADRAGFDKALVESQKRINGFWYQYKKRLETILEHYHLIDRKLKKELASKSYIAAYQDITQHLSDLMNSEFILHIPYERWSHIPRYLKAIGIRIDRLLVNPSKDLEKADQLLKFVKEWKTLKQQPEMTLQQAEDIETLQWMLEEFRVSIFAPELRTAIPISPKRLEKFLDKIHSVIL